MAVYWYNNGLHNILFYTSEEKYWLYTCYWRILQVELGPTDDLKTKFWAKKEVVGLFRFAFSKKSVTGF